MEILETLEIQSWAAAVPADVSARTVKALEWGKVLLAPLAFEISENEKRYLTPGCLEGKSKNVSFRPATGALQGAVVAGTDKNALTAMLRRYCESASALIKALCPEYRSSLTPGFTSFRPAEISGRATSWRKDDTRLHVDAFPSTPLQGRRILRVFSNVNPSGKPRSWRIGEPVEDAAKRFASKLSAPMPGSAFALQLFHITKSRRTPYDHYMLQMHDQMKADEEYQKTSKQLAFDFPAGTTWACYTDQVLHAASAGQHQLEQTFYLPVDGMLDPQRSPLRILERAIGTSLVN